MVVWPESLEFKYFCFTHSAESSVLQPNIGSKKLIEKMQTNT